MPKLTQAFVKRIKCSDDKKSAQFFDDEVIGLFLEVRQTGGKTYYLRSIDENQKRKYIRISDANVASLSDARIKALKLKKAIEEGKDVVLDIKEDKAKIPTLNEFYQTTYLPSLYSKTYKNL